MNFIDSYTEVWKPKLLSISGISLSIVFGIPQIDICKFLSLNFFCNSAIPLCVPSPPITYS